MALIDLTSPEMVELSGAWLDEGTAEGKVLARDAALAPLLGFVREAHEALVASQVVGDSPHAERIQELSQRSTELDRQHDALVRGVLRILTGLGDVAKTEKRRAGYEAVAAALFPEGPASALRSYAAQAGSASMVDERLTAAHRQVLESLASPEGTLAELVARWKKVARALGESDNERTRLLEVKASAPSRADHLKARHGWVRAVDVLRRAIALAKLPEADVAMVLANLTKAEARGKGRGAGGGVEPGEVDGGDAGGGVDEGGGGERGGEGGAAPGG